MDIMHDLQATKQSLLNLSLANKAAKQYRGYCL